MPMVVAAAVLVNLEQCSPNDSSWCCGCAGNHDIEQQNGVLTNFLVSYRSRFKVSWSSFVLHCLNVCCAAVLLLAFHMWHVALCCALVKGNLWVPIPEPFEIDNAERCRFQQLKELPVLLGARHTLPLHCTLQPFMSAYMNNNNNNNNSKRSAIRQALS